MAIVGPNMNEYGYNDQNMDYINLPPKIPAFAKSGIFAGTRVLLNRRVDALGDTSRYPEGCIVHKSNYQVINGVELCDVTVDYYKYSGVDDDVYFMFGTDYLGRDLWTRVWRGARISLVIAFVSVILNSTIGLIYGSIAGYYGGSIDMVMMRITEIINAMPTVVVVTLFILYFGNGLLSIIMALVVQNWIGTARMIRAQFYRFKNSEYVLAARTLGVGDRTLMSRHILPNSIGPIITRTMVAIPSAIFTESFLAYIGLGIRAPESSIGVLLSEGRKCSCTIPNRRYSGPVDLGSDDCFQHVVQWLARRIRPDSARGLVRGVAVEKERPILRVDDLSVSFRAYAGLVKAVRGVKPPRQG